MISTSGSVTFITFAELKNSEEEKAKKEGLFDKARTNATALVENFMRGSYDVGGYVIKVSFQEAKQQ